MKKDMISFSRSLLLSTLICISVSDVMSQGISINTNGATADSSALLDIQSTTKGFLMPRMTTDEREEIDTPAIGLLVYDTDTDALWCYAGTSWIKLTSGSVAVLQDEDGDTQIHVEKTTDEDVIRFELASAEQWVMIGPRLEPRNSGGSVFIGEGAGLADDTTGNQHVAIGQGALAHSTYHRNMVAIGDSALHHNSMGAFESYHSRRNTAVGSKSQYANTTGYQNTSMGFKSLYSNTYGRGNVAVGFWALLENNGSQNTGVGSRALETNLSGNHNSAFGHSALIGNTSGHSNTAVGQWTLYNNTASKNTSVGAISMQNNTTGHENSALGESALYSNISGHDNTAIGFESLYYNLTSGNTAVGFQALKNSDTGFSNTAMGWQSAFNNDSGKDNTSMGYKSLHSNLSGDRITAIGFDALNKNTTGNDNTAIGRQALFSNTIGTYRTAAGMSTNSTGTSYTNNTGLGYNADCTASDQVRIGNSAVSSIGGYANWSNVSDMRFKNNIHEDVPGLDFIQKLRPVTYHLDLHGIESFFKEHYGETDTSKWDTKYDKENVRYTGFIAQEVEQAALQLNYDFSGVDAPKNTDDFYGLRYAEFVVPLVKAVQELSNDNNKLAEQVTGQAVLIEELRQENLALHHSQEDLNLLKSELMELQSRVAQMLPDAAKDRADINANGSED